MTGNTPTILEMESSIQVPANITLSHCYRMQLIAGQRGRLTIRWRGVKLMSD